MYHERHPDMAIPPRTIPRLPRGDGSLGFDRKRGKWTLRHVVDGKAVIERGESRAEVEALRDARRATVGQPSASPAPRTLDELFDRWIAAPQTFVGLNPNTVASYLDAVAVLRDYAGDWDAMTMRVGDVDRLLATLAESYRIMPKLKCMLNKAMTFAVRSGWRETNPVASSRAVITKPARPRRFLTTEEHGQARRLFTDDHSTLNTALAVIMLAGLRPGEALGLRWANIDDGHIRVEEALWRDRRSCKLVQSTRLKTDHHGTHAHRMVPLRADLRAILSRERKAQMARGGASEFVFVNPNGTRVTQTRLNKHAAAVARQLGYAHVSSNGYRHVFASELADRGLVATLGAQLMGHSSTAMWNGTYTHAMREAAALDLDALVTVAS